MKRILLILLLCTSSGVNAATPNPLWVPSGWKYLGSGIIRDIINAPLYLTENGFRIRLHRTAGPCEYIVFHSQNLTLATDESLERAWDEVLLFYALKTPIRVHGFSCDDAVSLTIQQ